MGGWRAGRPVGEPAQGGEKRQESAFGLDSNLCPEPKQPRFQPLRVVLPAHFGSTAQSSPIQATALYTGEGEYILLSVGSVAATASPKLDTGQVC